MNGAPAASLSGSAWVFRFSRPSRGTTFPAPCGYQGRTVDVMWTVLLILLVVWVILSIVGFVFHGLLWLAIIGIVLFVGTLIFGFLRRHAGRAEG